MIVTGPPAAIWRRKIGATLPLLPITLPNRTHAHRVTLSRSDCRSARCCTVNSAILLVAPMMLLGFTALSVEIIKKRSAPKSMAVSATVRVPRTLFRIASLQLDSIMGTCL